MRTQFSPAGGRILSQAGFPPADGELDGGGAIMRRTRGVAGNPVLWHGHMVGNTTDGPRVITGTAGWSYPDWAGRVYPARRPRGFHPLAYLASYFDVVEINTSFYHPVPPAVAEGWVRAVRGFPAFRFTAKLWRRFTHEDDAGASRAERDLFLAGLRQVEESGRLAAILLQFPFGFRHDAGAEARLARLAAWLGPRPLAVEFRHASWLEPAALRLARDLGLHFVNIDQPEGRESIPPTAVTGGALAYVRLHGRNASAWFDPRAGRDARYDYLYSSAEIAEWVDRIRTIREGAPLTVVIANNHFEGKAAAAALEIRAGLAARRVDVPESLLHAFPSLERVATPAGRLF